MLRMTHSLPLLLVALDKRCLAVSRRQQPTRENTVSFLVPGAVRSNSSPHLCASCCHGRCARLPTPWARQPRNPTCLGLAAATHSGSQSRGAANSCLDLREKRASSARKSETGFQTPRGIWRRDSWAALHCQFPLKISQRRWQMVTTGTAALTLAGSTYALRLA